jgi:transcription initiation factor TFIIH subunit 3
MKGTMLVVILDMNCDLSILNHLLLFIHAHQSQSHNNNLLFITSGSRNEILYPRKTNHTEKQGNEYKQFHDIDQQIKKITPNKSNNPKISGALSLALTYINKHNANKELQARILVMSSSKDDPSQHISIMNTMFAAQRAEIKIDVCRLSSLKSVYLPQACFLTKGIFKQVSEHGNLIHYLLYIFLADGEVRDELNLEAEKKLDFRATCFCHKKNVDLAFVCSVCLSSN